jgi:signal transduction histidine kinase
MEAKNITLTITEKRPLNIRANKDYTEIFLSNLLSNAIKYNRENGDITVVIDQKSVTIQDTGIGIAKENLEKIFDRFYREDDVRMEESFGIGLSLVQRIAHIYKWTISVESEKGNGTKIKIQF